MKYMKEINQKKHINVNIGLGSVMKEKVRDMEDNTRNGRSKIMRKKVVICFQDVVGKSYSPSYIRI